MADYLSLLMTLVEGLPADPPDERRHVFDRARRALADQLSVVDPPLTEIEIDRELRSLESAIAELEAGNPVEPRDEADEYPAEEYLADEPLPDFAWEPEPEIAHERDRTVETITLPPRRAPPPDDDEFDDEHDEPSMAIRRGRKRPSTFMLAALALLAVPIAGLAFLWRDKPDEPIEPPPATAVPQQQSAAPDASAAENKFGERVGTARSAPVPPPVTIVTRSVTDPRAPAPPAAPASQDLAVAQRVLMFEENPADPPNPIMTTGRAVWRLEGLNPGQGQPLETVVRGTAQVPATGLALAILIRRNTDPALPASHTIELSFGTAPGRAEPAPVVRDVALPMMRPEETVRGVSIAGLPVPVKENVFLIGLSDLKGDVDRNTELLLRRNWMELPIRFASGQKSVLLIEKGLTGERVFTDAFRQWGQAP